MPWLAAYAIIAMLNVGGEATGSVTVIDVTKPLLMPLLIVWLVVSRRRTWQRPLTWLLIGMVFAWLGDLLLMGSGTLWFIAGVLGFLLMNIAYLVAFSRVPGPGLVREHRLLLVPYLAFWVLINVLIAPGAGDLRIPVLAYSMFLVAMGISALDLVRRLPHPEGWRVAVGGMLFIASDTLLAVTRFDVVGSTDLTGALVMLTYVAAQVLIVVGFARGQALAASRSR